MIKERCIAMKHKKTIIQSIMLFGIAAMIVTWLPSPAGGAVPSEYCSVPPYLSNTVRPNVLIVMDNSGSMNDWAYSSSFTPADYPQGYYGYFYPTKNYIYNNNAWEETLLTTGGTIASPIASGSFLNWATMRRIDVARKLLIGGKATPRSPNPGTTVALYGETSPSPTWDFAKSDATDQMSGFTGDYSFEMRGDDLYVNPNFGASDPDPKLPDSNYNTNWSYSKRDHYLDTNDKSANDDLDYIYNNTDISTQLFGYTAYDTTEVPGAATVDSVTVRIRAEKPANGTCRIRAAMEIDGVEHLHSNYSNLSRNDWNNFQFTWTVNPERYADCVAASDPDPATCGKWQPADLNDPSSTYFVDVFGVRNITTPTSSLYAKVTWLELSVSLSAPTGGPYATKVDWDGGDWAMEQGIMTQLTNDARFGLAWFNGSNKNHDGGYVDNEIGFNQPVNMITSIHNMTPDTYTPLGETVYEMVRYFRQDTQYYYSQDFDRGAATANDPYYFRYATDLGSSLSDQYVPCAKSFILLLTDGESTKDLNLPDLSLSYPGEGTARTLKDYDADSSDPGTYGTSGSDYLDDVTLWARVNDARPGACSGSDQAGWTWPCLPGTQNIITYSVFMFGTGSQLLKDAAINGGFEDLIDDDKPACTNPAIPGSPTQNELKECYRDTDENGILDPAVDLPLTYFEGDDGYELRENILLAITSILRRAASGTAVSVLTTSSRGVGSMVQAYFLPKRQEGSREVSWTGYSQNLWLDPMDNLREDTVNDATLKLDEDSVLKLYFDTMSNETMVAAFNTDADGNSDAATAGDLASCSPASTKQFMNTTYLWETGKKLAEKLPSTRTIFTSKKSIVGSSTTNTFTTSDFSVATVAGNTTDCGGLAGETLALCTSLNPDATYTADNIVKYIRGECLETGQSGDTACGGTVDETYRDRRIAVGGSQKVWKLGDIINATPKVFGNTAMNSYHMTYGDNTYTDYLGTDTFKQRSAIGFIGANDGMLHAIRIGYLKDKGDAQGSLAAGVKAFFKDFFADADNTTPDQLGEEVWAYIPYNAFPYLKYLADPTYCHIYYNDLTTYLVDVSLGGNANPLATDVKTKDSWKTILIGGMRFGGACAGGINPTAPPAGTPANVGFSSFYAIDITDPAAPVPLWEFTDSDMGYASSYPGILRTGASDKNGSWYLALGSGSKQLPRASQDIARTTPGYIYVLDLKTGSLVKKVTLDHNAIVGDILAVDANRDYRSEAIYFGTAYKDPTWKGKLVSIAIPDQDLTSAWTPTITYLFTGDQPFTASPDAVKDSKLKVWVYAGTGKYFSDVDEDDTTQQLFFGLKHDPANIAYPLTTADMDNTTAVDTTGTVTGTSTVCMYDPAAGAFAEKGMVTSINRTSAYRAPSAKGWYVQLSTATTSERVISKPLAIGGLVDFLSYKPNDDPCAAGGDSYLYSLGYTTGIAPENIAILSPGITTITAGGGGGTVGNSGGNQGDTVKVNKGIKLGPGAPPTGEAIIIPPAKGTKAEKDRLKKKIQVATGVIIEAENETAISVTSTIMHWLRK